LFSIKNSHVIFDLSGLKVDVVKLKKRFTIKTISNVLLTVHCEEYKVEGSTSKLEFNLTHNNHVIFSIQKNAECKGDNRSIFIKDGYETPLMICVMFAIILVSDFDEGTN
jgi:uncharacterized protein YxjI